MSAEPVLQREVRILYGNHHGWLHAWLRRKLGCAGDAADLAQDTYVRILARGQVPPVDDSRRHLVQIAKGLVVDLYRRRRIEAAYRDVLAFHPETTEPSLEQRALTIETLMQVDAVLDSLPSPVRDAFLLRQLEGMSYRDIALHLGVSVSSVEKYVARALVACCELA